MCNKEMLSTVLFRGYLDTFWIDFANLRLVCKTWRDCIWESQISMDARCLGVVGKSNEVTLTSCLLAKVPPLASLEWLELDYCFDRLSPELSKREIHIARTKDVKSRRVPGYTLDEETELEPSARQLLDAAKRGSTNSSSRGGSQSQAPSSSFWPNLRCVSLRCVDFPLDDGDAYVISACCSERLEVLDLSRRFPVKDDESPYLGDYGGICLSQCRNLRFLDLAMNSHIGDEALYHICVSCNQLRALGLAGCQGITAKGVHFIRKSLWKTLEVLDISTLASVTDESLVCFASGRLEPMALMDAEDTPLQPQASSDWDYDSETPHPGWASLWCLMASFLPNVKETSTIIALLNMVKASPAGQSLGDHRTALEILECRGFRGGNTNVDEEAYIAAKKRGVACLFKHQDQDDLMAADDRVADLRAMDRDLSRLEKVWPPSMLTFRPSQHGDDHFYT